MPLHENIVERDDVSKAGFEMTPQAMPDVLEVTDVFEHGKERFNEHALIPLAALADFTVERIAVFGVKAAVTQHNHLLGVLFQQRMKLCIIDVGGIALPIHHQGFGIEERNEFGANDPAMIAFAFLADLLVASPFASRMQQFEGVAVTDAQHGGGREKAARPVLMRGQSAKQASAVRQPGKQGLEVALEPTIKSTLPDAFERMEQTDGHQFTGMEVGLRMFGNFFHGVIRAAKQLGDKICCGQGVALLKAGYFQKNNLMTN